MEKSEVVERVSELMDLERQSTALVPQDTKSILAPISTPEQYQSQAQTLIQIEHLRRKVASPLDYLKARFETPLKERSQALREGLKVFLVENQEALLQSRIQSALDSGDLSSLADIGEKVLAPEVEGIHTRCDLTWEVENMDEVKNEFKTLDRDKIRKTITVHRFKAAGIVGGIRILKSPTIVVEKD